MKRVNTVNLLFFVITLSIYAGAMDNKKNFGKELFPVNINTQYLYETSFGETTTKSFLKNGLIEIKNDGDNFKYYQKLILNDSGVYINETYQKIKLLLFFTRESRLTYKKPLLRYSLPLFVGKEWSDETIEYEDSDSNKVYVKGKAVSLEDMTVKAGKFTCLKVETIFESETGSKNIITEWIAENVGMVKTRIEIKGGGLMGFARDILGYGIITFELKDIVRRE